MLESAPTQPLSALPNKVAGLHRRAAFNLTRRSQLKPQVLAHI
jgi:hypothetical protein